MALHHDQDSALAKAIRAAGSQTAFGELLGKRQSVVSGWLLRGSLLPAEYVLTIEAATGISRHDLRPDIYPRDAASPVSSSTGTPPAGGCPPACIAADIPDPVSAQTPAGGGNAARSISCDPLDRAAHDSAAADAPPIGKAAA